VKFCLLFYRIGSLPRTFALSKVRTAASIFTITWIEDAHCRIPIC